MTTVLSDQGAVVTERDERGVVRLTLQRPEARNALSPTMVASLRQALETASADKDTRVVVLAGAGRSFCAGGDIDSLRQIADASLDETKADARQFAELYALVANLSVPLVARVQGGALGGGTALAACADIVVAARNAVFGCTEVRVGVIPAVVAPFLRRRLSPAVARRLLLTGERVTADRALVVGLVDEVVDETELDSATDEAIGALLAGNRHAQRALKPLLGALLGESETDAFDLSVTASARFRTSPESKAALAAFLATLRAEGT